MESVEEMGAKVSSSYNHSAPAGSTDPAQSATNAVDGDSRSVVIVDVIGNPCGRFCPEHEGSRHGASAGVGVYGHRPQGKAPFGFAFVCAGAGCGLLKLSFGVNAVKEKNVWSPQRAWARLSPISKTPTTTRKILVQRFIV